MTPDRLRTLIDRHGLSQRETGQLLGVAERTVRSWLAGERSIPLHADRYFDLLKLTGFSARRALPR